MKCYTKPENFNPVVIEFETQEEWENMKKIMYAAQREISNVIKNGIPYELPQLKQCEYMIRAYFDGT